MDIITSCNAIILDSPFGFRLPTGWNLRQPLSRQVSLKNKNAAVLKHFFVLKMGYIFLLHFGLKMSLVELRESLSIIFFQVIFWLIRLE